MAESITYPMTHQGVRNLDSPIRPRNMNVNIGPEERAASTFAGALLAGFGLGRGGVLGMVLSAAGAACAYRGVTGHCSAYAAAGINTAKH